MISDRVLDRLVVHAHVPRAGAEALNRSVFLRRFRRDETLLAYDDRYAGQARMRPLSAAEENCVASARFAMGHLPYGFFDGLGRWTLYISVFDDPVRRFLSFAGSVLATPPDMAAALLSDCRAELRRDDPDALCAALLDVPAILARQCNSMTRIAAGLPAVGVATEPAHLSMARANIERVNYLVARRDQLSRFAAGLREILCLEPIFSRPGEGGWERGAASGAPGGPRPAPIRAEDLSTETLRRIEQANALDMALYDRLHLGGVADWD